MLENLYNYVQVDDDNRITVDEIFHRVSWTDLDGDVTGYVYCDKGANHFGGDFEHKFEMQFYNCENYSLTAYWLLANDIMDFYAMTDGGKDAHFLYEYDDNEWLYFGSCENGVRQQDGWVPPGPLPSTTYFITITRDDDGGANNTGQLTCLICTGNYSDLGGTLKDTLVQDCAAGKQNDFQYVYAVSSWNAGNADRNADGFTQNLELGDVVYRRRIGKC